MNAKAVVTTFLRLAATAARRGAATASTAWRGAATVGAALLIACGPGVVGTGSPLLGASGASGGPSLCSAPVAVLLPCAPAGVAAASTPVAATLSDAPADGQPADVQLRVDGNAVSFQWRCGGLTFDGRWSLLNDGSLAFHGTFTNAAQPQGSPGILRVSLAVVDGRTHWRVSLHDPLDALLAGPWLLLPTTPNGIATCAV